MDIRPCFDVCRLFYRQLPGDDLAVKIHFGFILSIFRVKMWFAVLAVFSKYMLTMIP